MWLWLIRPLFLLFFFLLSVAKFAKGKGLTKGVILAKADVNG